MCDGRVNTLRQKEHNKMSKSSKVVKANQAKKFYDNKNLSKEIKDKINEFLRPLIEV